VSAGTSEIYQAIDDTGGGGTMTKASNNAPGPRRVVPSGPIQVDGIYPVDDVKTAMGWGARSFSEAKQSGLKVLCFGRRSYIYGRHLLEFLQAQPAIDRNRGGGRPDLVAGRIAEEGE